MIIFEHVSKVYPSQIQGDSLRSTLAFRRQAANKGFTALNDISFHLKAGESLGILGRNGAGKSTLLKLLTRVSRPTSGQITVRGRLSSLLEVGAGFHHDLSGHENIFLAGAILGMNRGAVKRKLDEMIDFAGLASFIDAPVRSYSSGMLLRLAFSVGIHLDSKILVIDEALAVGDRDFQTRCFEKIKQFKCEGGTLVLVSHDDEQLRAVCKRGLLLSAGKVAYNGDIETALTQYHSPQFGLPVLNEG